MTTGTNEAHTEKAERVRRVLTELRTRFVGRGCMARAADFPALLPEFAPEDVEEALHLLAEQRAADLHFLSDGTLVFFFPR